MSYGCGTAVALPLDVARPETFEAFRAELAVVLAKWDRTTFDFLVSNAGVGQPPVMFEDTTAQTIEASGGYEL